MDKQKVIDQLIHTLEYDADYADLSGYAKDLKMLVKENKELADERAVVYKENQQLKRQYVETANKLKSYQEINRKRSLALKQISVLANGGVIKHELTK